MTSPRLPVPLVLLLAFAAACGASGRSADGWDEGSAADGGSFPAQPGDPGFDGGFGEGGGGSDTSTCAGADATASNVGCEFWAVDLDNEYSQANDAAGQPWGVVLANAGTQPASVTIERNDGAPGQPLALAGVKQLTVGAGALATVQLPTREVDGSLQGKGEGPGTFLSSNAYRIKSTSPLVVYQFNALAQAFSNDASLLIPTNGLGNVYRVLGWPTANPITLPQMPVIPGLPDHSFVTIVGTVANTTVVIKTGGKTVGGSGITPKPAGGSITVTLGPFDVFNLESDAMPGDLTGTVVTASAPVAVFTGGERGIAPISKRPPPPPSYDSQQGHCCTDHLEEQLFPVSSMGKQFVVTRSPIRSTPPYVEYDILRFMGVAATAIVKTNLPAPDDQFTLAPGEIRETFTDKDFVAESSEPIAISQMLVSQGYTESSLGDPSLTIFPASEQYRRDYLFLVPTSWKANYVVVAAPVGASVTIDGAPLPATCVVAPAGTIGGQAFEARRCPVSEGPHKMSGTKAFGITAYGYGPVGSYAFIGGADVKKIYVPPPIK